MHGRPRQLHQLLPLHASKAKVQPQYKSSQSHNKSNSPSSLSPFPSHSSLKRGFDLLYQITGGKQAPSPCVETRRSASCAQTTSQTAEHPKHKLSKAYRKNALTEKLIQTLETYMRPPPQKTIPLSDVEKLALLAPLKPKLHRSLHSLGLLAPAKPQAVHTRSSVLKRLIHLPAVCPSREPQFKPTGAFEHLLKRKSRLSIF